jgi:hypothetical protein
VSKKQLNEKTLSGLNKMRGVELRGDFSGRMFPNQDFDLQFGKSSRKRMGQARYEKTCQVDLDPLIV